MQKTLLICLMLLSRIVLSSEIDPSIERLRDKGYLRLPDGREIIISYHPDHGENGYKVRLFLRKGSRVLWDKTFSESLGTLWHEAYFIPLYKDKYLSDLNSDASLDFAIAVWSGGNATEKSSAFIFSVINDSLKFIRKEDMAIEFARSVYW
jgi:hypothetical protein